MGTFRALQNRAAAMNQRLVEFSGLEPELVENILQYAKSLLKSSSNEIDETVFTAQMVDQFEITSTFMVSQMAEALKKGNKNFLATSESGRQRGIPLEDFCRMVCTFLSQKLDIKINWVFGVYDTNNDGSLSKLEMHILLKPCVLHTEDMDLDEAIRDLIEIVMSVVDVNKNGLIDLEEFRHLVKTNILYIDLLGQVLPRDHVVKKFLQKIKNKSPNQVAMLFQNERARALTEAPLSKPPALYPIQLEIP
ncbi:unnamed protein product [Candidula unifasciata]|uniref:EF-hand domain-containing protein n=1 Tax=Candidula unifasciata TaxID=100452 RepID=A0A8S3YE54_9EUPU|nr:unnamed protein product [Candidula unifasciata]